MRPWEGSGPPSVAPKRLLGNVESDAPRVPVYAKRAAVRVPVVMRVLTICATVRNPDNLVLRYFVFTTVVDSITSVVTESGSSKRAT